MKNTCLIRKCIFLIMGVNFFIFESCSNESFQGSRGVKQLEASENVPEISQPSSIEQTEEEKLVDYFNKLSPEEKKEFIKQNIDADATEGKDFKICLYYRYDAKNTHKCNHATFNVILNKQIQSRYLDLNNYIGNSGKARTVVGISGKQYSVPNGSEFSVPGTLYTTSWKDKQVIIETTCNKSGFNKPVVDTYGTAHTSCHTGIANLSVIGNVMVNYNGKSRVMYFYEQKGVIKTNKEIKYELENRESYENLELTVEEPKFSDWCTVTE